MDMQAESLSGKPLVLPLAHPLDEFYRQAGLELPVIRNIPGETMPEPYRSLLVHQNDMTPTLEQFYGRTIHLQVFQRRQRDNFYFREVILLLDNTQTPVEFGAIKINLALFPPPARRLILEEKVPLGRILNDYKIPHSSRPKGFLAVESDEFMARAFKLEGKQILYGRRNTLADPVQRSFAEIVEILPPSGNLPGAKE